MSSTHDPSGHLKYDPSHVSTVGQLNRLGIHSPPGQTNDPFVHVVCVETVPYKIRAWLKWIELTVSKSHISLQFPSLQRANISPQVVDLGQSFLEILHDPSVHL